MEESIAARLGRVFLGVCLVGRLIDWKKVGWGVEMDVERREEKRREIALGRKMYAGLLFGMRARI